MKFYESFKARALKYIWCRVAPSTIKGAGVGVVSVRYIPKGTRLFYSPFPAPDVKRLDFRRFNKDKAVPNGVKKFIWDMTPPSKPGGKTWVLAKCGYNDLNMFDFMNHSEFPNVEVLDEGGVFVGKAFMDIRPRKELFINYGDLKKLTE